MLKLLAANLAEDERFRERLLRESKLGSENAACSWLRRLRAPTSQSSQQTHCGWSYAGRRMAGTLLSDGAEQPTPKQLAVSLAGELREAVSDEQLREVEPIFEYAVLGVWPHPPGGNEP